MSETPSPKQKNQRKQTPADNPDGDRLRLLRQRVIDTYNKNVRAKEKADEPVVHHVSPRQAEQTKLEMARGAEVSARHAAQQAARPPREPDPTEGTTTPVFRPADFIPNMKQGNTTGAKTVLRDGK